MDNYNKNELSGKITDKELAAFESTCAICENHHCGYGLTISKKENKNKYIVFQCEYKSDEIIYEVTRIMYEAAAKGEFGNYHVIGKGMTKDFIFTSFWETEEY